MNIAHNNSQIQSTLGEDEEILWSGNPDLVGGVIAGYINLRFERNHQKYSTYSSMMIFQFLLAFIIIIFSNFFYNFTFFSTFIIPISHDPLTNILFSITLFIAIGSLIFIIDLLFRIYEVKSYQYYITNLRVIVTFSNFGEFKLRSFNYDQILSLSKSQNFLENLFHIGSICLTTEQMFYSAYANMQVPYNLNEYLEYLKDSEKIFQFLTQVQNDVKSDILFPNSLREQ